MEMILTGIENKNEYYTNHYFTSIFQDNAEDIIKRWKQKEKQEEIQLPWKKLRDVRTQYYNIRDRYLRSKNEEVSKPMVQKLATLYLKALGYESINSVSEEVADGLNVPIFHEVTKANGAPLLWAFLSVVEERDDDILQGYIFEKSDDEDENGASVGVLNDDILAKLFFAGEEAPRFGGADTEENWATTSMLHNSIKNNWTLEQLNWQLYAVGNYEDWDGLTGVFVELVEKDASLLDDTYIKKWYHLSKQT